jgi:hypothetical protein
MRARQVGVACCTLFVWSCVHAFSARAYAEVCVPRTIVELAVYPLTWSSTQCSILGWVMTSMPSLMNRCVLSLVPHMLSALIGAPLVVGSYGQGQPSRSYR